MLSLCRHHLLAVFTVFAVLCGFAHQVEARFEMHHHCEMGTCGEQRGDSTLPDHQDKACDHALCAHSILALVESPAPVIDRAWTVEAHAGERAVQPPEMDPAAIDHPPQLA